MSTLILCKNQIAASPFFIEEASLNVYSLEELSYFILNNPYLLSKHFMSIELCNWVKRELKLKKLGDDLTELVMKNAPLHIFVGHILSANGYSSQKEIKDLLSIILTFENKSEAECKKMRADRLIANGKIVDAIYEYESLLSEDLLKTVKKETEGDIYHNLGCAFAKLFLFDEAAKCFEEAYKKNLKKTSLFALLYAARCKKDKELFDAMVTKYQVPSDILNEVENTVAALLKRNEIEEFSESVNSLSSEGLLSYTKTLLKDWREDYIRFCRI